MILCVLQSMIAFGVSFEDGQQRELTVLETIDHGEDDILVVVPTECDAALYIETDRSVSWLEILEGAASIPPEATCDDPRCPHEGECHPLVIAVTDVIELG